VGILACGPVWTDAWWRWDRSDIPVTYDYYFFQGLLQRILPGYVRILRSDQPAPYFHPGKSAIIELKGKRAGEFGILKPQYAVDMPSEICYASLNLDVWEQALATDHGVTCQPVRRHPLVKRDLSIVVPHTVAFDRIEKILDNVKRQSAILQQYDMFSRFEDKAKLGPDMVSYSMHLTLRHAERTLSDEDITTFMDTLTARLQKELGAVLR
jgi:phenylalanyl-tRNA synthetase beta chain